MQKSSHRRGRREKQKAGSHRKGAKDAKQTLCKTNVATPLRWSLLQAIIGYQTGYCTGDITGFLQKLLFYLCVFAVSAFLCALCVSAVNIFFGVHC
jgi:hypothetical protein